MNLTVTNQFLNHTHYRLVLTNLQTKECSTVVRRYRVICSDINNYSVIHADRSNIRCFPGNRPWRNAVCNKSLLT